MADYDTSGAVSVGQLETAASTSKTYTEEKTADKLEAAFLTALPAADFENDFTTDAGFVAKTRCTVALAEDEDGNGYCEITAGTNAANLYAYSYYNLSDILTDSLSYGVIEFDALINEGSRMKISLVDLAQRYSSGSYLPGSSSRDSYDTTGIAFRYGEYNSGYAIVQNATPTCTFGDWMHFKYAVDVAQRTVTYTITDRESGDTLFSGTSAFLDDSAETVSGIEVYGYVNSASCGIGGLSISAAYDVNDTTVYLIGSDADGYDMYMYSDGEPQLIGQHITVDTVLSTASTNPVQNKVVTARLNSLDNGQQECLIGLSVSGQTVTYTKMDGTTGTITTQDTDTVYTHPSYSKTSNTSTGKPAFGGTFTAIDSVTTNSTGHVTAVNTKTVTVPSTAATQSTAGLMSADDKTKLDGIDTESLTVAVDDELLTTSTNPVQNKVVTARLNSLDNGIEECISGLSVSGTTITYTKHDGSTGTITTQDTDTVYTHPSYSKTANTSTGKPAFGGTFTAIDSVTTNSTGHVTAVNTKTVTVPSTAATTETAGLMSATDKEKLDGIDEGATAVTVDTALNASSTNAVQNKAVTTQINSMTQDLNDCVQTLTASGKTVTYTKIDGSTGTFTTQDTTYSAATQSTAGLMSATDKTKLDGIDEGATAYTHPDYSASITLTESSPSFGDSVTVVTGVTTNTTGHVTKLTEKTVTIPSTTASTSAAGLMTTSMVTKLNGIATGATKNTVDTALSSTSTNAVQNKVIYDALSDKLDANFESNGYVGIDEITQDLDLCINNTRYMETPVQIGTWIDNTPVWRQAFNITFTEAGYEIDDQCFSVAVNVSNDNYVFIIGGFAALRMSGTPCVIDDYAIGAPNDSSGYSFDFSGVRSAYIKGLTYGTSGAYGYIDFVTPASNISN